MEIKEKIKELNQNIKQIELEIAKIITQISEMQTGSYSYIQTSKLVTEKNHKLAELDQFKKEKTALIEKSADQLNLF